MPFDDKKFDAPADHGDVAGVAIYASLALGHIARALEEIRKGKPISESHIKGIQDMSDKLDQAFTVLTGWTKE